MTYTAPSARALERAQEIRDKASRDFARLAARDYLRPEIIEGDLARRYRAAQKEMSTWQETAAAEAESTRARAMSTAFGMADLGGDPASRASSHRDAADRADRITEPREAAAMFTRAADTGDEALCRALAHRAHREQANPAAAAAWAPVLETFAATRPAAMRALETLHAASGGKMTAGDLFAYVVPKPVALSRMTDGEIAALAAKEANGPSPDYGSSGSSGSSGQSYLTRMT